MDSIPATSPGSDLTSRWEVQIEPDTAKSKRKDFTKPDKATARNLGAGLHVHVPAQRRRSVPENLLVFAVIPSLLAWTAIFLLIGGNFNGAIQVVCAALAGGFVGWHLRDTH